MSIQLPDINLPSPPELPQPTAAASVEAMQYLRSMNLIVATSAGKGIDFADFKVTFSVRRGDWQSPNTLDARIYNLSDRTANLICGKEFTQVALSAGYQGNNGLIFRGNIIQTRKGRLDAKDTYVEITAGDGDEPYLFAHISQSLIAGSKPGTVAQSLLVAMQNAGAQSDDSGPAITQGYQPNFSQNGCVRGQVLFGMARDELRRFAEQNDCSWSIQDGKLTFIPLTSYAPGTVPLLSPSSGLIGVPEQTQGGIRMTVLLNPNIRVGQLVKLDQSVVINQLRFSPALRDESDVINLKSQVGLSGDGTYYVMSIQHAGDTRGEDWHTDLICLSADATKITLAAENALTAIQPTIERY